jgi:hypothetical protein
MRVLEQHQHRRSRRQPFDLRHQCPQCPLLLLLRGEVERRIALAGGDRQQCREQRRGLAEIVGRLRQHRLELVEPLLGRILAPEPGRPLELVIVG